MKKVARKWKGADFFPATCYKSTARLIRLMRGKNLENKEYTETGAQATARRDEVRRAACGRDHRFSKQDRALF